MEQPIRLPQPGTEEQASVLSFTVAEQFFALWSKETYYNQVGALGLLLDTATRDVFVGVITGLREDAWGGLSVDHALGYAIESYDLPPEVDRSAVLAELKRVLESYG